MTIKEELNILANNVDIDLSKNYGSPISGYTIPQQLDIIYNSIEGGSSPEPPEPPTPPTPATNKLPLKYKYLFENTVIPDATINFINSNGITQISEQSVQYMFERATLNTPIDFSKVEFTNVDGLQLFRYINIVYEPKIIDLSNNDILQRVSSGTSSAFSHTGNCRILKLKDTIEINNRHMKNIWSNLCQNNGEIQQIELPKIIWPNTSNYYETSLSCRRMFDNCAMLENVKNIVDYIYYQDTSSTLMINNCPNLVINDIITLRRVCYGYPLGDNNVTAVKHLVYDNADFINNDIYCNLTVYPNLLSFKYNGEHVGEINAGADRTLNLSGCPLLDHSALAECLATLPNNTGNTCNINITGCAGASELTGDEIAQATIKNWNVITGV